ncbi:thiamine diphosphokinase [Syntrophus gentianae]|uniref:Thiamine diphosphokinase n=1 Tax=Syntrophus gentianae TaxID=43775 RepID=A0A1H7XNE6_9BACT|nr:thiamine diphosphokinase [Syntrophus gentianae]SEM34707.1 thiamine diphosphokinase [Syntrophus gentianae]
MKKKAAVICGGEIRDYSWLRARISAMDPCRIICADVGARHCMRIDIDPEVVIGDMDSLDQEMAEILVRRGTRISGYPSQKDETDTQLALQYALSLEPEEIRIFGALGGRIDHTLANMSILKIALDQGVPTRLVDEWCEIVMIRDRCVLEGEEGQTVSLFPFSSSVTGITLRGFAYPLENNIMEIGLPYGISNVLTGNRGVISLSDGILLVIHYYRKGHFPEGV